MLLLRQYVEDEFDWSFEVSGEENFKFTRKLDAGRFAAIRRRCPLLVVVAL
jgi:hypothetical protein